MNVDEFIRNNSEGCPRWFINLAIISDNRWLRIGMVGTLNVVIILDSPWWVSVTAIPLFFAIDAASLLKGWKRGVQDVLETPDDFKNL